MALRSIACANISVLEVRSDFDVNAPCDRLGTVMDLTEQDSMADWMDKYLWCVAKAACQQLMVADGDKLESLTPFLNLGKGLIRMSASLEVISMSESQTLPGFEDANCSLVIFKYNKSDGMGHGHD